MAGFLGSDLLLGHVFNLIGLCIGRSGCEMTAKDLCEKVLAADKTWKQSCDCCVTYPCGKVAGKCEWVFTDAAPLLAKMVDHTLKFCEAICACEHRSDPDSTCIHCVFLAALDQIARGDGVHGGLWNVCGHSLSHLEID